MSEENQNSERHYEGSIADHFICPITHALPLKPVTAEDGRIYERSAIEEYFARTGNGLVTSPITREPMGTKLLPAGQVKNLIEDLVEKGLVKGDVAGQWIEIVKEKKETKELLRKAEAGDVEAMVLLGNNYNFAGFSIDWKKSFLWYKRAHEAGSVTGTTLVGVSLVYGQGVEKSFSKGFMYVGIAAEKGSELAALFLGGTFGYGFHGAGIDKPLAIHWLEKITSGGCVVKDAQPASLAKAQELLDELKSQTA